MSREPLVTVGMPVYNGAPYVEGAIRSLLQQTMGDLVLVISDDGSSDGTPEICAGFADDSRVRFIAQPAHLGMSRNFDYVLRQAGSLFFMWAAQDDRWAPDFIEVALGLLQEHPSAIGCATGIEYLDGSGQSHGHNLPPVGLMDPNPVTRARTVNRDHPHLEYGLFRRERLSLFPGLAIPDVAGGDGAFSFRVAVHGPIVVTDRVLMSRHHLGYEGVVLPDGSPGFRKSLGPDGYLYSHDVAGACRSMLAFATEAPISSPAKFVLWGDVMRLWIRGARSVAANRNHSHLQRAREEGRHRRVGLLAARQVLLAPRASAAAMGRRLSRWRAQGGPL